MKTDIPELSCFVISPIGSKNEPEGSPARLMWEQSIQIWEEVIQPASSGVGLSAIRADQISEAGDITEQVFRRLRDAHVVIADLTDSNPNVMYELGLRHTTGKITVQLGEEGRLPFDISTIRTIRFRRTAAGLIEARRALVQALAAGLEGRYSPVMATRVWLESPETELVNSQHEEDEDAPEAEEPGFLEILLEMETALSEMTATMGASTNVVQEIGAQINWATDQANNAGGPAAQIGIRLAIANALATRLEDPATRLEALSTAFADSVRRLDPGLRLVIEQVKTQPDEKQTQETLAGLIEGTTSLIQALDSARQLRSVLITGRPLSKALGRETRRIARALDAQVAAEPTMQGWLDLLRRDA